MLTNHSTSSIRSLGILHCSFPVHYPLSHLHFILILLCLPLSRSEFVSKRCDVVYRRLQNLYDIYIMHDANEVIHHQMHFPLYKISNGSFPHFWRLTARIVLWGWHVLTASAFTFVKTAGFVFWYGAILCLSSKLKTVWATRATISSVCSTEVAADKGKCA